MADEQPTQLPAAPEPEDQYGAPIKVTPMDLGLEPYQTFGEREYKMIRLINAFADSFNISKACLAAGVSRNAWYTYMEDVHFQRLYQRTHEHRIHALTQRAMERAMEDDDMNKFVLSKLNPAFKDKQVIEVVSPDVQSRLVRQAEAIVQVCRMQLGEQAGAKVAGAIAEKLTEIWVA